MNQYQRARERAGFTQKEFAKLVGVEPSVISRYETDIFQNAIVPSKERRQRMADACGITLEFLENDDPQLKQPLTYGQKERLREQLKNASDHYRSLNDSDEILIKNYGNSHPLRYVLRDRWEPIVEDVIYLAGRIGFDEELVLNDNYEAYSQKFHDAWIRSVFPNGWSSIRTQDEISLDVKIDQLLLEFYSEYSDSDILDRIRETAEYFNRIGKIDLLRLVQRWFESGRYLESKPPQDQEDPEAE